MSKSIIKFCFIAAIFLTGTLRINCQNDRPEVFKEGSLPEQLKFLDEHTRIYENYRAIREDMFQAVSKNTLDTLTKLGNRINGLVLHSTELNIRIDSLNKSLEVANNGLSNAVRTKNRISVLGVEVNKIAYNAGLWSALAVLVLLLSAGYVTFRQNRIATLNTRKDLKELNEAFEEYKIKTRLEREKMNIDHFNEIKKLKSGPGSRA